METGDDPDVFVYTNEGCTEESNLKELEPDMDFRYGWIVLLSGQNLGFSFLMQLSH